MGYITHIMEEMVEVYWEELGGEFHMQVQEELNLQVE